MTKCEKAIRQCQVIASRGRRSPFGLWISSFFRHSDFVIRHSPLVAWWLGGLVAVFCIGCSGTARIGGSTPTDEVIDELRVENDELREEVAALQERIALRLAEIEALEQKRGPVAPASAVDGAEAPRLAALRFDRYSGAVDTDGDAVDDLIRVYVRPFDQDGRFLPVAGRAVLQAVVIEPGREPAELASRTFTPAEFKAAYRSSFTGTHYTLELPLPADLDPSLTAVTLKLTFTDAATGVTLSRQAEMRIDAVK